MTHFLLNVLATFVAILALVFVVAAGGHLLHWIRKRRCIHCRERGLPRHDTIDDIVRPKFRP